MGQRILVLLKCHRLIPEYSVPNLISMLMLMIMMYCMFQVTHGSRAAQANLCIGDQILAVDGEPTENMTHLQAQNKIKGCLEEMVLSIDR